MSLSKTPLLLHAILEALASLSFTLNPSAQLPSTATDVEARLILRSYGGLLLSTSILCGGFYLRPGFDGATRLVAGSMAVYHLFPIARAWSRLRGEGREKGKEKGEDGKKVLGGPGVHLAVHLVVLGGLVGSVIWGRDGL
ncbi:hypothetical protein GE09DRAFT_734135 [Coniochaeta sp. 2T2.1]|nr:hypothetical protein GE09DRAFT_734135 [Coniochaeta sp. 2T2.1]